MNAILEKARRYNRKFQRIKTNLPGRFMMPDQQEYPCQVMEMSPGDIKLYTPVKAAIGDRIVVYIDVMGRFDGTVARLFESGMALTLQLSPLKQDRIADKLTWLTNKDTISTLEDRRHERKQPEENTSHITLPDGRSYECQIMDISISGAALTAPVCPDINTYITLGKMSGKVVRHLDNGFAVEFAPT
ncbi:MAG: pilus assembly protein PilZ [Hyphomicrobiales bacterium]|nr:MAG: pilus assembly protein PilZ [Hyphomicrobiales bacterium]